MELFVLLWVVFIVYFSIKCVVLAKMYGTKAIDMVFETRLWRFNEKKYLPKANILPWMLFWLHPFRWTFEQYFPGLTKEWTNHPRLSIKEISNEV